MKTTLLFLLATCLLLGASPALAVHDDAGDTKCLDCHFTLPFDREKLSYTEEVGEVCRSCHTSFPCNDAADKNGFAHPIKVVPTMTVPIDMPLDQKGRITCITCHSYHAEFWDAEYNNESLLRRTKGVKLCYTCHKKL